MARIGVVAAGCLLTYAAAGQTTPPLTSAWKRIAGTTINDALAEPASGPVFAAWYAAGSSALLAQTVSGRIFETTDFVHWRLSTTATVPASGFSGSGVSVPLSLPEPGAKLQPASGRLYAMGSQNLYASEDNGQTWLDLTGFNSRSVIGGGFSALAISPANPQEISAANLFGIWRSLDGGLTWQGLNDDLPNLAVRKLLGRRTILLAGGTLVEARPGGWSPAQGSDPELALRAQFGGPSMRMSAPPLSPRALRMPVQPTGGCWFPEMAARRGMRIQAGRWEARSRGSGWTRKGRTWHWRQRVHASFEP